MKILLIEDDPHVREVLSLLCAKFGGEVHKASSLEEARNALEVFPADLVISDNRLPDGFGPGLFPVIREKLPKVFIALLSGDLNEPADHGADVYVRKPANGEKIERIINLATEHKAAA